MNESFAEQREPRTRFLCRNLWAPVDTAEAREWPGPTQSAAAAVVAQGLTVLVVKFSLN